LSFGRQLNVFCRKSPKRLGYSRLITHPKSTPGLLMDLADLKFLGPIAGMIAMAILAVIVLAGTNAVAHLM
jgi:hypothetical protein